MTQWSSGVSGRVVRPIARTRLDRMGRALLIPAGCLASCLASCLMGASVVRAEPLADPVIQKGPSDMEGAGAVGQMDRKELIDLLVRESQVQQSWVGIHAAEFLIDLGEGELIVDDFRSRLTDATPRHRIGVWRVLARCDRPELCEGYVQKIRMALIDPMGEDRIHALEALAKLSAPMTEAERPVVVEWARNTEDNAAAFAQWRLVVIEQDAQAEKSLQDGLKHSDPIARMRSAYALWKLRPRGREALQAALRQEPADSALRPLLVTAIGGEPVLALAMSRVASVRTMALAELGTWNKPTAQVIRLLADGVKDSDADVRVSAAWALLNQAVKREEAP